MKRKMRLVKANGTGTFPNSTLTIVPVARKFLDADGYYELLGIDPRSSQEEIKRAAKHKLMETHPDKGGNEDDFCAVMKAYQTLSNPVEKAVYDTKEPVRRPSQFVSVKQKIAFEIPAEEVKPFGYYKNMTDVLVDKDVENVYNWLNAVMEAAYAFGYADEIRVGIGGDRYDIIDGIAVAPKNGKAHQQMAKVYVLRQKIEKERKR